MGKGCSGKETTGSIHPRRGTTLSSAPRAEEKEIHPTQHIRSCEEKRSRWNHPPTSWCTTEPNLVETYVPIVSEVHVCKVRETSRFPRMSRWMKSRATSHAPIHRRTMSPSLHHARTGAVTCGRRHPLEVESKPLASIAEEPNTNPGLNPLRYIERWLGTNPRGPWKDWQQGIGGKYGGSIPNPVDVASMVFHADWREERNKREEKNTIRNPCANARGRSDADHEDGKPDHKETQWTANQCFNNISQGSSPVAQAQRKNQRSYAYRKPRHGHQRLPTRAPVEGSRGRTTEKCVRVQKEAFKARKTRRLE